MRKLLASKKKTISLVIVIIIVVLVGFLVNYFYHRNISFSVAIKDRQEWVADAKEAAELREKTKNNVLTKEQVNNFVDTIAGINAMNQLISDSTLRINLETQILGKDALTNKYIQISRECKPTPIWDLKNPLDNPPPSRYNSCDLYLYYLLNAKANDADNPEWQKECASVQGSKVTQYAAAHTKLLCTVVRR
jgi:hypothetical protein